MQKLADIQTADLLAAGLFPDLPKNQQQLFKSGFNVEFNNSRVHKSAGVSKIFAPTLYPKTIIEGLYNTQKRIYYTSGTELYGVNISDAGVASAQVLINSGAINDPCSMCTFGNWVIVTDNVHKVKVFKGNLGVDTLVDLNDVRVTDAYLVRKNNNHVLLYYDTSVDWSSDSDAETWVPTTANTAGRQLLRDLDSKIYAVENISGNTMAIMSRDQLITQTFSGDPFIFSFGQPLHGIGAISGTSVASHENRLFGLGPKGFWTSDGISYDYIDRPDVRDYVFNNGTASIDLPTRAEPECGFYIALADETNDQIKWWYVCLDGQTRGVVYNYKSGAWSVLSQSVLAVSNAGFFASPIISIVCDVVGQTDCVVGFAKGANLDTLPLASGLTSFAFDANVRESWKLWDLLRLDYEGAGLQLRFGFSDDPADAPDWGNWFDVARDNFIGRESVYITLDFRSTALDSAWAITGASIHGEVTGDNT